MKQFLNNLQTKLSKIPNDKLLHFFYGSVLVGLFDIIMPFPIITLVCVMVLAGAKEIYDELERDSPIDYVDIIFTILPAIINLI